MIEMILYVAICSGLLLSLSIFFTFLLGQRVKNQAIQDVNQQGQQVMWLITQTVRNARSIESPSIGVASSSLSVTTADPLRNPTLFSLNGGTLQIQEGASSSVPLTNSHVSATSLLFENVSSSSSSEKILRVRFVLSYINPSGKVDYEYTKSFLGSATLR